MTDRLICIECLPHTLSKDTEATHANRPVLCTPGSGKRNPPGLSLIHTDRVLGQSMTAFVVVETVEELRAWGEMIHI
jgi:hypothetical protein